MLNNTYNQTETNNSSLDLTSAHETGKMSSLDIAEITGKEHRSVLRDIRNLIENLQDVGGYNFVQSSYINKQNKNQPMYELGKKECLLLASGYDVALRAKIINRWEELETKATQPVLPQTYKEALKQLLAKVEENETLQQQNTQQQQLLAQQAPKVEYYDKTLQAVTCLTTSQIAKSLGMTAIQLNKKLKQLGIQFYQSGMWMLTATYAKLGLTNSRTHTYTCEEVTRTAHYTVWTEKGNRFISALFSSQWNVKEALKTIK